MGEAAAQVLSAAAVIGRSFEAGTARYASGRSEEETVDSLERLVRRGLIREIPGPAGEPVRFDFSHGILRDAAYDGISLARRRLLHRRTADALRLEPTVGARDDVGRYALIALHEREAGRPAEAAAAFLEAAGQAQAVFANREAIGHLEAALRWTTRRVGSPCQDRGAAWRLGEYPQANEALETAARWGAPDLSAIEVALGRVHRRRGDLRGAASHLDAALGSHELDPSIRTRALVERCCRGAPGWRP